MGQEASVPVDGGGGRDGGIDALSLEEQAKAPPSTVNPPSSSQLQLQQQQQREGSKRNKLNLPNMFQRSKDHPNNSQHHQNQQQQQQHHHHHNHHDLESFEQREAARAAAAGGNLYQRQGSNDDDLYALQKMPSHLQPQQQHADFVVDPSVVAAAAAGVTTTTTSGPMTFYQPNGNSNSKIINAAADDETAVMVEGGGQSAAAAASSDAVITTPSKKGLFPGRASARGMINSMRNLSIGGALRKQKEIHDWEKQWDEDDDESDDGGEPSMAAAAAAAAAAGNNASSSSSSSGMILRPGMDAGHSSSGNSNNNSGLMMMMSVPPPPPLPPFSGGGTPKTPPRSPRNLTPKQKTLHRYPSAPPSPIPTPDFLSSSSSAGSSSPLRQQQEWDAMGIQPLQQQQVLDGRKPDVQMFLPVLRVLGKGSFGKVVLVQKREGKERGQLFAMKILKKTHLVKRRQIERTRTERKVLSVVNHPFIMKLHYAFQTPDKLYLVLDYCPGGELFFHLSRFRRFPERVARFYAAELLLAIGHLHKRGIIYRDLKPENVLLDAEGHVKLGDFGLAKAGIQHPYEGATSMCGTPEYMAPEVLGQLGHGFCVDYWGLGMIVYEMMTGLPPWYTTDRAQLFRRLKSAPLDIPSYFSESSGDCVAALLERNPRRRLGVTGIRTAMEHDFFRNISWRALYSRRVEAPVRPCEGWKPPDPVREHDPLAPNGSFQHDSSKQFYSDGVVKLDSNTLDTATQNFDAQFTRMPVESEDHGGHDAPGDDSEQMEDLDENTFLGFSFDIVKERDKTAVAKGGGAETQQAADASSRQRTQNYHSALDQKQQQS